MSRATDQSEALLIAEWLESGGGHGVPSMHALRAARELRRLDRVNAELVAQNEAQKNEWLSWEAKRRALERDAARYQAIRSAGSQMKLYNYDDENDPCSGDWHYKPSPEFVDEWVDSAIRAALTSAKGDTQ